MVAVEKDDILFENLELNFQHVSKLEAQTVNDFTEWPGTCCGLRAAHGDRNQSWL